MLFTVSRVANVRFISVLFFLFTQLFTIVPNAASARDGLCGTAENIESVINADGLDLVFFGLSTSKGEFASIYGSNENDAFIVVIEYVDEKCIVFSGTYFESTGPIELAPADETSSNPLSTQQSISSVEQEHFGKKCKEFVGKSLPTGNLTPSALEKAIMPLLQLPPVFLNFKDGHYVFSVSIDQQDSKGMPITSAFLCVIPQENGNPFIPETNELRYWTQP